jgi:SAM-dependent methyltransferase
MPVTPLAPDRLGTTAPDVRVLEIGAGTIKRVPHAVTLDVNPLAAPDVLHDLDVTPYPFPASSFDIVIAEHVLEHVNQVIRVVEELHRIVAPGGVLLVEVPHFSSANFHTDPTHRHAFSTRSFDYFVEGTTLARYRYSNAFLRKREGRSVIQRAIARWANRDPERYERKFAWILPAEKINFVLEVVK